jgi:hypothetical protein
VLHDSEGAAEHGPERDVVLGSLTQRIGAPRTPSHPFVSLVATFRFLEEVSGLEPAGSWGSRIVSAGPVDRQWALIQCSAVTRAPR